jgi:hypothetical protein
MAYSNDMDARQGGKSETSVLPKYEGNAKAVRGSTREYQKVGGRTREYKGVRGSTREYEGSTRGVRGEYEESTREYKGSTRGVQGEYEGVRRKYEGSTRGVRGSTGKYKEVWEVRKSRFLPLDARSSWSHIRLRSASQYHELEIGKFKKKIEDFSFSFK